MQTAEIRQTRSGGQRTRSALIERADEMLRTQGYSGFSFGGLAMSLGIGKASIHHHFPTKEALALEIMRHTRDRFVEMFERIERETPDAADRLGAYAEAYLGSAVKGHGCVVNAILADRITLTPGLRDAAEDSVDQHLTWLSYVIDLGQKNGQLRSDVDPDQAASLVMSTLEGALMLELAGTSSSAVQMRRTVGVMMLLMRPVGG